MNGIHSDRRLKKMIVVQSTVERKLEIKKTVQDTKKTKLAKIRPFPTGAISHVTPQHNIPPPISAVQVNYSSVATSKQQESKTKWKIILPLRHATKPQFLQFLEFCGNGFTALNAGVYENGDCRSWEMFLH